MPELPKHIHVIGISGVATSALAIAFHKKGVKVTGSDKGFFPPASTELEKHGIPFYAGWHPENIEASGKPDLIIAGGGGTSLSNPEIVYAKQNGIPLLSFAEALGRYFIRENSIVAVGTWGKTTSSALLSFILLEAGMKPSYFTGGVSLSHPTGEISDSDWSVVEGDEYQAAIWDKKPKFAYYSPTHLLLTAVSWDHADLYPTEKDFFRAFENLVAKIPDNGLIVACADDAGVARILCDADFIADKKSRVRLVMYGKALSADYRYHSVTHDRTGLTFSITHKGNEHLIASPMLGRFNVENITGCFAMALEIGIPAEKIVTAIAGFKGIKRRLERRYEGDVTVLDCHAPTAEKAASVLESIREVYDKKVIAIYEPNIGGRQRASAGAYDDAFKNANLVIIPRLTKLKVSENEADAPMEGDELTQAIGKTQPNVKYIDDDAQLVEYACAHAKKGDVIAFLGSHGFRGMIEETINKLT